MSRRETWQRGSSHVGDEIRSESNNDSELSAPREQREKQSQVGYTYDPSKTPPCGVTFMAVEVAFAVLLTADAAAVTVFVTTETEDMLL